MLKEMRVSLFDMVMCLSGALDLVNPAVVNHHKRVAFIAFSIASELGLSKEEQNDIIMAGSLHDLGAITLEEKLNLKHYNLEFTQSHAQLGYLLIRSFDPFARLAPLVRHHHVPWHHGEGGEFRGEKVPLGGHILHLADRIEVLIQNDAHILGQTPDIIDRIGPDEGKMFVPELVEAFLRLAKKEYFWLDCMSPALSSILERRSGMAAVELDLEGMLDLARLFSQIIDFRSRFTATHSKGVSVSAEALAKMAGLSERDCLKMRIAGYLHDLGKLAVPAEILDKNGPLTKEELQVVRTHTYHTYRILENIEDLYEINTWGAFHHERLDGSGYPFHHGGKDMPLGSRIMAVADVLTATTEDRPYRPGMQKDDVLGVLGRYRDNDLLDPRIIDIARDNYDALNAVRMRGQEEAGKKYEEFWHQLTMFMVED